MDVATQRKSFLQSHIISNYKELHPNQVTPVAVFQQFQHHVVPLINHNAVHILRQPHWTMHGSGSARQLGVRIQGQYTVMHRHTQQVLLITHTLTCQRNDIHALACVHACLCDVWMSVHVSECGPDHSFIFHSLIIH